MCVFQSTLFKNKIALNQRVTVKGKWNRAKQEINGNRMFFNQSNSKQDELEPIYRIKDGINKKYARYDT